MKQKCYKYHGNCTASMYWCESSLVYAYNLSFKIMYMYVLLHCVVGLGPAFVFVVVFFS